MDLSDFYDDVALPADQLVAAFALDAFDRAVDADASRAGQPTYIPDDVMFIGDMGPGLHRTYPQVDMTRAHLRVCLDREAVDLAAVSARTCGEGTCDYGPEIRLTIRCPHGKLFDWYVEADSMGELIGKIAAFADSR